MLYDWKFPLGGHFLIIFSTCFEICPMFNDYRKDTATLTIIFLVKVNSTDYFFNAKVAELEEN